MKITLYPWTSEWEVALAGMKTALISLYISIGALSDQVHFQ